MDKLTNTLIFDRLNDKFGDRVQLLGEPYDLLTVAVDKSHIIDVLSYVKTEEELSFNYLTDITAAHYPNAEKPFVVIYHVHNMFQNIRIRFKVALEGNEPSIPSATAVWKSANWMERETYDFFGIDFEGHPDLRRILNMDDLGVFPMRKEYPLEDPNRVDKKDFYFGR